MNKLFSLVLLVSLFASAQSDNIVDRYEEGAMGNGESLARVTVADKYSYIRREGDPQDEDLIRNMSVISGDAIETRSNSYAEIEFIDGTLLQIADRTRLEFQAINESYDRESLTVVKLFDGSIFLHTTEVVNNLDRRVIRIDTADGSVYIEAPGIYRVDCEGNRTKLRTYRGMAELAGESDSVPVYSGEYATISGMRNPSRVKPFNSFNADRFERWAYERRPGRSVSSKYVPSNLSSYARDLDDSGSWRYDSELSMNVWIPSVQVNWAPFRRGYWSNCGPNLTWVSYEPWGYITHHYGRWMWRSSWGWYWCPDRYYSPAWVAWSNHDSYIGWCPLGWWGDPYYYNRNRVVIKNTVVINHWNYIPATVVVNRRRDYQYNQVVINGPRRISTRPVYVERDDFRQADRLTRVVSDPEINRRRASAQRNTAGTILMPGTRNGATVTPARGNAGERVTTSSRGASPTRVRIEGASTGTSAPSRHVAKPSRRGTTEGSSDRSTATSRGSSTDSRNDQGTVSRRGGASDSETRSGGTRTVPTDGTDSGSVGRRSTTDSTNSRSPRRLDNDSEQGDSQSTIGRRNSGRIDDSSERVDESTPTSRRSSGSGIEKEESSSDRTEVPRRLDTRRAPEEREDEPARTEQPNRIERVTPPQEEREERPSRREERIEPPREERVEPPREERIERPSRREERVEQPRETYRSEPQPERETPRYEPPPRQEMPRNDPPPRQEAPRYDPPPRNDPPPRQEAPRYDPPPRQEAPRYDPPPRQEAPRQEAPRAEEPPRRNSGRRH